MKKFILKFSLFLVLILTGSAILDYVVSKGLQKTEDYRFQTWTDIINKDINADVVISGNSRAFSHYKPQILDSILKMNSQNIGIGGYPLNVQYMRYCLYEKYQKLPKLIIQNVDFGVLTSRDIYKSHECEQLLPFVFEPYLHSQLRHFGYSYADLYLPIIRYFGFPMVLKNGLLEYLGLRHYSRPSYKGYRPERGAWDNHELNKLTQIDAALQPEMIQLLSDFLKQCKNNNTEVLLVNSPVFHRASEKLVDRKGLNVLFDSLATKYDFHYLDYTNDPICFDSTYFCVAVHMNEAGAELFSTKLAHDIDSLGILK